MHPAQHNTTYGYLWWWYGGLLQALCDCGSSECKMQSGDVLIFELQDCPTALIE